MNLLRGVNGRSSSFDGHGGFLVLCGEILLRELLEVVWWFFFFFRVEHMNHIVKVVRERGGVWHLLGSLNGARRSMSKGQY